MTAAVLVAADAPADGDQPGQPYISPDDLASIQPLWDEAVEEHLMPLVAGVWDDSAGMIHAEMLDATDIEFPFPSVGSVTAEAYMAQVRNVYDGIGDELWETARAQLAEGFAAGESIPQLVKRLQASAGLTARRATLVARSTVIEASNAGSIATARAAGIDMQKEWIATPDERTRKTHHTADGQKVDLADPFTVGGFSADVPGDPGLPPQEKYNCRCTVGFVMADAVAKKAKRDAQPELPLPGTSGAVETPAAVAPPVQAAPTAQDRAATRKAARARQKAIADTEPYADFAAEIDQVTHLRLGQPWTPEFEKILRQRIALAETSGIAAEDLAAMRAAVAAKDLSRIRAEARALADSRGLVAVDEAGLRVPFDPARHTSLIEDVDIPNGRLVVVDRQGHVLHIDGDTVQLDRAKVRAVPGSEAPTLADADATQTVAEELEQLRSTLGAIPHGFGRRPTGLTPQQRRALRDYQGVGYYGINGDLRIGELAGSRARDIRLIDDAMAGSRLTRDVDAWRGAADARTFFGSRLDHDLTGVVWQERGYMSTSALQRIARDFTYPEVGERPVLMRITVPKGTGAVELSGYNFQAEMLLERGLSLRVVRDRGMTARGYRLLDVEVLPAAPAQSRALGLAEHVATGIRRRELLSGGKNAKVELVTFNDGSRAVLKTAKAIEGQPPRVQQDAEELAAKLLRSLGVRAPETYRPSARQIYMEYLDGQVAAKLPRVRGLFKVAGDYYDSDDGRLIGLADLLMENYDRNAGNWLVAAEERLRALDHGFAFVTFKDRLKAPILPGNYFTEHFHRPYPNLQDWSDNDLSPADIAVAMTRLERLRPEFERLGHEDWYDNAITRLGQIGKHATGTRRRIGPALPITEALSPQEQLAALNERLTALQNLLANGEQTDPETGEQVQQVISVVQSRVEALRTLMRKKGARR